MTQIDRFPVVSHLRAESNQHVLRHNRGKLVANGCGLTFWFRPLNTAIAIVPTEDLEIAFLFHGRSNDFQEVHVQGVVAYRVSDFPRLAQRVDFSVDLATGLHRHKPLERISGAVTQLAQQLTVDFLATKPLAELLAAGCDQIRQRVDNGLRDDHGIADLE